MENCTSPVLLSEIRSKSAQRGPSSGEGKKKKSWLQSSKGQIWVVQEKTEVSFFSKSTIPDSKLFYIPPAVWTLTYAQSHSIKFPITVSFCTRTSYVLGLNSRSTRHFRKILTCFKPCYSLLLDTYSASSSSIWQSGYKWSVWYLSAAPCFPATPHCMAVTCSITICSDFDETSVQSSSAERL